jgi:CBS domain-containing protein
LYSALKLLSKGRQHQVPIVDAKDKVVGVISQRDVLKFFAVDPSKLVSLCLRWWLTLTLFLFAARLGDLRTGTVRGLALATGKVSCVRTSDLSVDAFFSVALQGFGGAAIIDADGALVGNLSVSDLALVEQDFTRLQHPVRDFIRWQNPKRANETDTLEQVVNTLYAEKVRRLYLVNPTTNAPSGIITLTDVIGAVFRTLKKPAPKAEKEKKKTDKFKAHLEHEANKKGAKHSAKKGEKSHPHKKKDVHKKDKKKK